MKSIRTASDLRDLENKLEGRTLELKGELIASDELVKIVQAGANGSADCLRIIIGARERQGRFSFSNLHPVQFPARIPAGPSVRSFDEYRRHLISKVRDSTEDYFDGFFEIWEVPVDGGAVIVLEVPRSRAGPHQHRQGGRFYTREPGAVRAMTSAELRDAFSRASKASNVDDLLSVLSFSPTPLAMPRQTARELAPGALISRFNETTGLDRDVHIAGSSHLWVKVDPSIYSNHWRPAELRKLLGSALDLVRPLNSDKSYFEIGRTDHGAAIWTIQPDVPHQTTGATHVLQNGEIWSIETALLASERTTRRYGSRSVRVLRIAEVEAAFADVVPRLARFALTVLRVRAPLRIAMGVSDVEGFLIDFDNGADAGRIAARVIPGSVTVENEEQLSRLSLVSFFEELWIASGRERPIDFGGANNRSDGPTHS